MDSTRLAADIKRWGRELGFQAVGIAEADLAAAEPRLAEWLGLGWHGEMDYMARHVSGGQRQRVAIARALVVVPTFVVADEPTSMLDVSIRTGIMKLMQSLAEQMGVTYLYITHDMAVARYMSNRLAVMYLGKIVEMGDIEELLVNPLHPYTKALLSAVPVPDPAFKRQVPNIKGSISQPINPLPRCRFYDRCPLAAKICEDSDHPPLEDKGAGHLAACYLI